MLLSNGKEVYGVIYKIENMLNGKVYIGQTSQKGGFDSRYRYSIANNTSSEHLRNSIEKYGIENFKIDKEFDIAMSKEELDEKEIKYIAEYQATNGDYGYNSMSGGAYGKHSEETKKKISEAQKGENHHMYGKHRSEETKDKIREGNKGKKRSKETRAKISESHKGMTLSDEGKAKVSLANKGNQHRAKKIICLELNKIFNSGKEAAEFLGCAQANLSKTIKNGHKCKGHTLKYLTTTEL